ncbi:16425_t:CDS:2 [Funneliformis geosporum]|nr:16425_t:CDS:2 [Funneliformis geosporum]
MEPVPPIHTRKNKPSNQRGRSKSPITERPSAKKARQDNNINENPESEQQETSLQNNISQSVFMETETIDSVANSSNDKDQALDSLENMLGKDNNQKNVLSFE